MLGVGIFAAAILGGMALQAVPEGVHRPAKGTETICGITASSALGFQDKINRAGLASTEGGARFDVFMSPTASDDMVQWAITKPEEPAYPAVTCRHIYRTPDGAFMQNRQMRCDASRAACDTLLVEFQKLDERMRAAMAAAVRR